jgi:hypothetical protein
MYSGTPIGWFNGLKILIYRRHIERGELKFPELVTDSSGWP